MYSNKEYNNISFVCIVKEKPKFYYTDNEIDYFVFDVYVKVFDQTMKVIASNNVIDTALKQAFVDKIYPEVSIWINGIYNKKEIYVKEIILIDDVIAANVCKKISDEEYNAIYNITQKETIVFKARVTDMKNMFNLNVSHMEFEYLPSILHISINDEVMEQLLKKANISRLHVSNDILVKGDLNSLLRTGYEGKIDVIEINLFHEDREKEIKKEIAQRKYIEKLIINMSNENKAQILDSLIWNMRNNNKVSIIYNVLTSKEKRKMLRMIIFGK